MCDLLKRVNREGVIKNNSRWMGNGKRYQQIRTEIIRAMIAVEHLSFLFSEQMKTDQRLKEQAEGKQAVIYSSKTTNIVNYRKYYNTYKAEKRNNEVFYLV